MLNDSIKKLMIIMIWTLRVYQPNLLASKLNPRKDKQL